MFSCHDMHKMASDYLDKRLSFMQRMKFRLHIFICHSCRRFVDQMRATIRTLHNLSSTEASPQVIEAQVERLLKQRDAKP